VSSSLLGRIAASHGAHHAETLTGFKWLSRVAIAHPDWTQVLAYEEAIGYAVGADVRDKDGLGGAVAVAAMTSSLAIRGRSLPDALDALHLRHGAHVTGNFSLRYEGVGWRERRDEALARLVEAPPSHVGDAAVAGVNLLAPDVMRIDLDGDIRVIVRPSGTEPKLKCYCEAVERVQDGDLAGARGRARARLDAVRAALGGLLGA
jgi:phosphomannomutase